MANLIPGVHVALHTRAEILHTAAWMDFSNYVRSLLHAGRAAEARTLWESVVEVIHNGTSPNVEVLGIPELPGVCRVPCMESPCMRCDTRGEAFNFLSWVSGPGRLFWPEQVTQLNRCGSDTMQGRRLLNSLRCKELPRALPVRSSFQTTPMEPWTGCGGVVRANDDRRRAGASVRCILGAVEAEVEWIPGPCRPLLRLL